MTSVKRLCFAFVGLAFTVAAPLWAEEPLRDQPSYDLDIEPQPLAKALKSFAEQSGMQVVYYSELADGEDSPEVSGTMTADQAMKQLLASTDLSFETMGEDTVVIEVSNDVYSVDSTPGKTRPASSPVLMAQNQTSAQRNQTTPIQTSNEDDETEVLPLEEILVTGSRIRGAQSASPVVTIDRQEIDQAGYVTVEDIVQDLPQNFGAGATQNLATNQSQNRQSVGGEVGNFANGTSVNLRGLGASSTLILLDGRRLSPSGRSASFTDISGLPVSAIERVEVLTDGASAIYGSDAIAGVVNFIMRDDYEGAETRLRYGSDSGGDTSEVLFAQTLGTAWDSGRVLFSYEYFQHDDLANIDRHFTASNDLTRFGGDDFRSDGGNPANIRATPVGGTQQIYPIPSGQDGTSLTAADFPVDPVTGVPLAPVNRYSVIEATTMLPEQERHSAFLTLSQNIGDLEFFASARFSTRDSESYGGNSPVDITVPDANPFFVDPTGTGLASVSVRGYSFFDDLGPAITGSEYDSSNVTLGLRFDMGDNWSGELSGSWSKEEASERVDNRLDPVALADAVAQTDPNLAFNPFGDGSNTNPAVLATLVGGAEFIRTENELRAVNLNIDGSVFDVPGGSARLATGVDYREESIDDRVGTTLTSGLTQTIDDSRDIVAVYAELFLPLVSAENSRSGLQRLELSLAGRYEDYSDFGNSTNPKVGIICSPTQSLTLRGTWGTSFRAPQLTDTNVNGSANISFLIPEDFVGFGTIDTTALVLNGANENLRPEEATTWTVGFQWEPASIKGLSVDVTYFDVDFEDRIDEPFLSLLVGYEPRFSSLLNRNTGAPDDPEWLAQVAAIVNGPNYQDGWFGPAPIADLLSGAAPVGAIMDRRINNLSKSVVTGAELQMSYDFETDFGAFGLGLNANYMFDFERALLATDPLVDEIDTLGRPVDFRARGNATWTNDKGWSVSGYVNYIDGYTDNVNDDPARSIESWTTVDLTVAYETGERSGFLSNTRISLITQNLFDEDPPFVNNFGLAFDPINANGLGRFLALQATKEW